MSEKTQEKEDTLLRNSHLTVLTLKSADKLFAEYGSWCWQSTLWRPSSMPTSKAGPVEF